MNIDMNAVKEQIAKRKELVFKDDDIGNINVAIVDDTKKLWLDKFTSDLYIDLLAYAELPNYKSRLIYFNLGLKGEDYQMHPSAMYLNLVMFREIIKLGGVIRTKDLFDATNINADYIKKYIDNTFVDRFKKSVPKDTLSNSINDILFALTNIAEDFSSYLGATVDLISDVEFMLENHEYNKLIHTNISDDMTSVEIEAKIKANADLMFEMIKNRPGHCMKPMIDAGEGVNKKQFAEYQCSIGVKPDGKGGIFPKALNCSYIRGLDNAATLLIDSNGGRIAQNIQKTDVGDSGAMAKRTSLVAQELMLHEDPDFDCGSKNYIHVAVVNDTVLGMLDGRYYRDQYTNDIKCINSKEDKHLIGLTLSLRSVVTCASEKICYKCYGDLSYINYDIAIGNYGSRVFSERVTQRALSAKHVLASNSEENSFSEDFDKFFKVSMNQILFNAEYPDINKCKIILKDDSVELDDYGLYKVNYFLLLDNKGNTLSLHPKDETLLYLGEHLSAAFADHEGDSIEFMLTDFTDGIEEVIFLTKIQNNDLTKTFAESHKLLETKAGVAEKSISQLVNDQIAILLKGGLPLPLVHIECVIRNMVRSRFDNIYLPDWSIPNNAEYDILTIPQALKLSPLCISLSFQEVEDQFIKPSTYKKFKSSSLDHLYVKTYGDI